MARACGEGWGVGDSGAGAVGSRGRPMRGGRHRHPQRHMDQMQRVQTCKPNLSRTWRGPAALGRQIVGPGPLIRGCCRVRFHSFVFPLPPEGSFNDTVPSCHPRQEFQASLHRATPQQRLLWAQRWEVGPGSVAKLFWGLQASGGTPGFVTRVGANALKGTWTQPDSGTFLRSLVGGCVTAGSQHRGQADGLRDRQRQPPANRWPGRGGTFVMRGFCWTAAPRAVCGGRGSSSGRPRWKWMLSVEISLAKVGHNPQGLHPVAIPPWQSQPLSRMATFLNI